MMDLASMTDEPRPDGADLEKLWQTVREARDVFRSRTRSAEESLEFFRRLVAAGKVPNGSLSFLPAA